MKNNKLKEEFESYPMNVQEAVNWWFSCLTSGNVKHDNGDPMASLIASFHQNVKNVISEESANKFKVTLARGINEKMTLYGRCNVDVDYGPCEMLAEAGYYIGKKDMMLDYPWKTMMKITDDSVRVSEGYGADYQEIWSNEEKKVKTKKK